MHTAFAAQSIFRGLCVPRKGLFAAATICNRPYVARRPRIRIFSASASNTTSADGEQGALVVDGAPGYDHRGIEKKWQEIWNVRGDFTTPHLDTLDMSKPKYYALDMFPYPSGSGLHVGHPEGYTATDIMSRLRRKQGYNVLHPMGWDAFGLPAEQYAIQTGKHPSSTTATNVGRFRSQLQRLGFSYDWQREISTTDPKYYRWTQWIFLRLWERGLAYQDYVPVNWCSALGTVLANEEVIDGLSERGSHPVERRPMRQWVLRITEYADRLLEDLDDLDWPESIKDMQRNWIGRSEGAELTFHVDTHTIAVYTTRPETIAGASYVVVAPEWPSLLDICPLDRKDAVQQYVENAARKSDRERTGEREKTGVFTGAYAKCNLTGRSVPVWVADYVLGAYGTGAVMAVPGHDTRDYEFAVKYDLPVHVVVDGGDSDTAAAYTGDGSIVNWPVECGIDLNGVQASVAKAQLIEYLVESGKGCKKVNYKLRDWLFSRQRYWGEPFPIVFVDGEPRAVGDDELPVELPVVQSYQPSGGGESPLANVSDWVNTVDTNGMSAVRETNTMPQWAGSCWYYLRFIDPNNVGAPVDRTLERYWMPVDLYVGGVEHAVLHLLYARFWHKVLYDVGVVSTKEPFQRLVNQGMILGEVEYTTYEDEHGNRISSEFVDTASNTLLATGHPVTPVCVQADAVEKRGETVVLRSNASMRVLARAQKMSKSRGNVVNPDAVVDAYGADALRCYLMFMGPLEQVKPWQTRAVQGMARFLSRAWRLAVDPQTGALSSSVQSVDATAEQMRTLHRTIKKVTEETEALHFNVAIAAMMEFVNAATKWPVKPASVLLPFVSMLGIYAPHVAEELWNIMGNCEPLVEAAWPVYEGKWEIAEEKTIVVQVNGKVRSKLLVPAVMQKDDILQRALDEAAVQRHLQGLTVRKQIYVPDKLVNLVASK